jgi:hypothetical protein
MKKSLNYLSYLLRLWHEGDSAPWRASLEDAHTGERRNFARLQDLFRTLEEETGKQVNKEASKDDPPICTNRHEGSTD